MPPSMSTEETAFLDALLSEMGTSFANGPPGRPPPSPAKHAHDGHNTPIQEPRVTHKSPLKDTKDLLNGAEEWDWDDQLDDEADASETPMERLPTRVAPSPSHIWNPEPCTRCIVENVDDVELNGRPEKILTVRFHGTSDEQHQVILQGDWIYTDVKSGDIVNIIGHFERTDTAVPNSIQSTITLSTFKNILILHPDILITATSIANSAQCARRPLIGALLSSTSDITPALVWGNMLHEIMQACLADGRWDRTYIDKKTTEIIHAGMESLVRLGVNVDTAEAEIRKRAKGLEAFSRRFIGDLPKSDAVLTDTRAARGESTNLAICGVHDTEEDIWSPSFGLKGKLDASLRVVLEQKKGPIKETKSCSMPFEIKTGMSRGGLEHRAQTMLYTLLMEERYGQEVGSGLLYYTQSDEVIRVGRGRHELRSLVQNRNSMAAFLMRRQSSKGEAPNETLVLLPPTLDEERVCKKCYAADACMLYRRAVEGVEDNTSEIAELYNLKTGHLTQKQCNFFKQWEALISLEEQEMLRFRKELWLLGSQDREKAGRCFADMTIKESKLENGPGVSKIHRHTYTFVRKPLVSKTQAKMQPSLLSGHITKGDAVTISIEPNLLALSRGFVLELNPRSIVVGVDHELDVASLLARSRRSTTHRAENAVFRIDKDEMAAGIGRIRDNLAKLFYAGGDERRRALVVDLQAPAFDEAVLEIECQRLKDEKESVLNENQKQAMARVLAAKDYTIMLGMPGTGKTTTIAEIIKELVKRGKTVLLSSYTHSAVDTILTKLLEVDFEILRLGNIDKVHPDILKYTLGARPIPTSVEQLERQLLTPPVVATTCLSVDHTLFSRRTFDVCIVDEASQITLPTCLGPLRFADKFVLVGDHFQLPPLVKSTAARKGGLDVSLFRRLSDAHPHAVVELAQQYRMNEDIMLLSNKLVYQDKLKCGNEKVAKRVLGVPKISMLHEMHVKTMPCSGEECWLKTLINPSCKVVFVDTDNLPAPDSRVGDLVQNEVEANLVFQLVEALLECGVMQSSIGVLTLYRQQTKLLSHLLQSSKGVEVMTADRSQGRDKDCVIISMVRSNDTGSVGDLLKDWRRLNVSFTRARSKLIIFGSRKTLQGTPMLTEFFRLMDSRGWIYSLPPSADVLHTVARSKTKRAPSPLDKENIEIPRTPRKRPKLEARPRGTQAILRGRPILRDLLAEGAGNI